MTPWRQSFHVVPCKKVLDHLFPTWYSVGIKLISIFVCFCRPSQETGEGIQWSIYVLQKLLQGNVNLFFF
jgi:hypothetical protein